jgi:hypothetical protein
MIRISKVAWLLAASIGLSSCGSDTSQYVPLPASAPDGLSYPDPNMFTQGVEIAPLVPTLSQGTPTNYMVVPDLPAGLKLDGNGQITGTPTEPKSPATYLVTAGNSVGTTSFGVRITVVGRFTIGGYVSGLTGTGLVLTNNGSDDLAVNSNGAFTFASGLPAASGFSVAVATQPSGQTCSVAEGSGALTNDNYGRVAVTCSANVPKAQRFDYASASGIRALVIDDSGTLLYAACTDVPSVGPIPLYESDPSGLVTLLGELTYEPGMDASTQGERGGGIALQARCGPYAITLDAEDKRALVTNTATHAVATYLPR